MNSEGLIPIFPLPVFILPGGITRLRIFEPRYLKMVKIATREQGFVIWLNNNNTHTSKRKTSFSQQRWASWVDIINFDLGDDGILEIDVKCHSLVELLSIDQDQDKLFFGQVSLLEHWSTQDENHEQSELAKSLAQLFSGNLQLSALYQEKCLTNDNWVVARWLELLPVDTELKARFVEQQNYQQAKSFVQSIVDKNET